MLLLVCPTFLWKRENDWKEKKERIPMEATPFPPSPLGGSHARPIIAAV